MEQIIRCPSDRLRTFRKNRVARIRGWFWKSQRFLDSFKKYSLNDDYVTGFVLGTGDPSVNKTD